MKNKLLFASSLFSVAIVVYLTIIISSGKDININTEIFFYMLILGWGPVTIMSLLYRGK